MKVVPLSALMLFLIAGAAEAKNCFWMTWERKAACECNNLGYHQGTAEFLQCYAIVTRSQDNLRNNMGILSRQLLMQRPAPMFPAPPVQCNWIKTFSGWVQRCF